MRQTFSISFVCRESKAGKSGIAPIEMSISVNGDRCFVTLPRKEKPDVFRKAMSSRKGNETKAFCDLCRGNIQKTVTDMMQCGLSVTASSLKDTYVNGIVRSYSVSTLFGDFLEANRCRVGKDMCMSVWRKYHLVRDSFIAYAGDVDVNELNSSVIEGYYNSVNSMYKGSTAQGYMSKLKTVFRYGMKKKAVKVNVFEGVRIKRVVVDVEFLTLDELKRIEDMECDGFERIERARDLFLFQCYTGLAYADMQSFRKEDMIPCDKGYYINKERQKTGVKYTVFLLPKAVAILEKYEWKLPVLCNQPYNRTLKIIADWCKIKKPLHSHIARHTCGTMLLNKGLGIDVVARILGHSNTDMTKHYAKLLDNTVVDVMSGIC